MPLTLVRNARQLLTLRGGKGPRRGLQMLDLGLIQDGAVLVRDGVILEAGPMRRIENLAAVRDAKEINAAGRVVMPGFVDSHTHLMYGLPWQADECAAASESAIGMHTLSSKRLEQRARGFLKGMIRHGTTTIEAKSGYGLDEAGEMKILRVLRKLDECPLDVASTYLCAHPIPARFAADSTVYHAWLEQALLPRLRERRLARFVDVYCERTGFDVHNTRRFLEFARESHFLLKVHAEQFSCCGGARLAAEMGAVSVDHLDHLDAGGIEALARSSTVATLLPGSVFHLGMDRYAPARELIQAGATVALATNFNPATSPTYSMQMVVSIACCQMKMTAAEAIVAATINGAHAMRMADKVGSLEAGKSADLILLNVADYHELPSQFGVNHVHLTMKRGEVLYREGEVKCAVD